MNIFAKVFIGFLAVVVFLAMFMNALAPSVSPRVNLEEVTFTVNNTYYPLDNKPNNNDVKLYYFENTTYLIPTARYTYNTSHIKLYTNGTTVCFANITAGCKYYASYTWNRPLNVWNLDFEWILIIIVLAVTFASIYIILKDLKLI